MVTSSCLNVAVTLSLSWLCALLVDSSLRQMSLVRCCCRRVCVVCNGSVDRPSFVRECLIVCPLDYV
jgi:hypothetical protein